MIGKYEQIITTALADQNDQLFQVLESETFDKVFYETKQIKLMKNITTSIALCVLLLLGCSKEEAKTTPVDYPIKFTADATPNNWEYVNRTDQNTINASFTTLERASKSYDTYYIQTSITSDFTAIKANTYANSSASTTKPEIKNVTLTVTKQQFPFQGLIYFRVVRDFDKLSSETRVIKVNWN